MGLALAGLLILYYSDPAAAVEFSILDHELTGSLDTTLSYGQLWRVEKQDKSNDDINTNDGNRNFDTGLVSEVFKVTSELEANYQNYGVFLRGNAFYDTQIMDKRNDYDSPLPSQNYPKNNSFTPETREAAGRHVELMDAYVYGNWDVVDRPVTAKLGRQVFNWGEGLFYRGGVNTSNPIDATRFRLPGAEIKEVLMPVEAFNLSLGLTDNLSVEGYYQWNWKETAIDPVGTYFSQSDLFAAGGNTAYIQKDALASPAAINGWNKLLDMEMVKPAEFYDQKTGTMKVADIGSDLNAKDSGQFGFALRYIAHELNDTEFGAYFVNYHAKEPQIFSELDKGYKPVPPIVAATLYPDSWGDFENMPRAIGMYALNLGSYVTARREYPENIRMLGLSFNTTLGEASVFGELAYRPNLPIAIAASNDLVADLMRQSVRLMLPSEMLNPVTNQWEPEFNEAESISIAGKKLALGKTEQLSNYERVQAFNTSLGTIYNFGPSLGFDSLFGVAELASEHLRGSDLKYKAWDGSTRKYASAANASYFTGNTDKDQITPDAYGYTLLVTGTWNDVFAGVSLSPKVVFKHDFSGNSHMTGNFIEGRKATTLAISALYLNSLQAELQYTQFYGAGQNNALRDRDNIGFNVKYSF